MISLACDYFFAFTSILRYYIYRRLIEFYSSLHCW